MDDPNPGALVRVDEGLLSEEQHANLARMANTLGVSGLFPDATDQAKVYTKILLGRSIGLSPMQAMTGIHIVEGKPQIAATTLASFVRESPRYDYRVVAHTEDKCVIELGLGEAPKGRVKKYEVDATTGIATIEPEWEDSLGVSSFTIEEAQKAGLGKWPEKAKWEKSQWGKWPKNMTFARALSNAVRWWAPDLFGGVAVYTEADEFTKREGIGSGDGDGEARGITLPPAVEAVIARASTLGHAALSNRATVEMTVDGLAAEKVAEWVAQAEETLDTIDVVDAEVVPADDDAEGWRKRSGEFLKTWEDLSPEEQETDAGKALKHEADTSLHRAMNIEEGGGVSATVVGREDGVEEGGPDA